ncbi:hypothetical protein [Lelliottia amnigena]
MNTAFKVIVIMTCSYMLNGCPIHSNDGGIPPCSVSPPTNTTADKTLKTQLALDLTKFSQAPISGNFSAEATKKISATFSTIPEKDNACAMLLQTYICISDKDRSHEFLQYVKTTGQCKSI